MKVLKWIGAILHGVLKGLDYLTPLGDFAARLWVSWIFFKSGLLKITSWDTTLYLFAHEFHVPLLSSDAAAVLATSAELMLPVLLTIGLGGRLVTLVFFIYNIIAIISYPLLWTPDGAQALAQHINWGLLLALLMFNGSGALSIDHLLAQKLGGRWRYLLR